jgi:hypothetical protein
MNNYVGIAGDWHANKGWARLRLLDFADLGIKRILHVGDFGVWDNNPNRDKYVHRVNKILGENHQTLYVTLGNHENYNRVSRFETVVDGPDEGWLTEKAYPHIRYAPRGHRWEWESVSFVSLGGANSIDRAYRYENVSWWQGEQIHVGEVQRTLQGGHADVFIAHDCPAGVPLFGGHKTSPGSRWSMEDFEYAQKSRASLRTAVDGVKPELLLHGHYHFKADYTTTLEDAKGIPYTLHSVGLDKDESKDNIAVLTLSSLSLDFIGYDIKAQRH